MVNLVTYLWEGTVVPEIALVREAVANEAEFALLDVLLDGVKSLLFGDLYRVLVAIDTRSYASRIETGLPNV